MKQCLEKPLALNVIHKINNKLKFLFRKNLFLTSKLRRLLCNALIQPDFDYACSAWYLNLTKKLKHRFQTTQNKCMCFCLQLDKLKHISHEEFERLSWLPGVIDSNNVSAQWFLSISMNSALIICMKSLMSPQRVIFN